MMYPVLNASLFSVPISFCFFLGPLSRATEQPRVADAFSPGQFIKALRCFCVCQSMAAGCVCARRFCGPSVRTGAARSVVVKWQLDEKGFTAIPSREELRRSGATGALAQGFDASLGVTLQCRRSTSPRLHLRAQKPGNRASFN